MDKTIAIEFKEGFWIVVKEKIFRQGFCYDCFL
jgi:hypothetical protein